MYHGWDISTAIVGHVVLDNSGSLVESDFLDLRKITDIYEKGDIARKWVEKKYKLTPDGKIRSRPDVDVHFVEQRLAGFSGGGSNAGTVMKLAQFNLLFSWFIHDSFCDPVVHLYPATVKATMAKLGVVIPTGVRNEKAKELRFRLTRKLIAPGLPLTENRNGKTQPWCWDMCDAFCVAMTGYLKHGKECVGSSS